MNRLTRDWRALGAEQRLAGIAAVALGVTMLLPWYQQNAVVNEPRTAPLQSRNLNAFQVFSFVEAAVLLVAVAVIYLLYARAEGKKFHLPGSDGAVVMAAGLWTALLLVLRLFDKPGISSHGIAANVGVQWGIFFALAAAGLLTYAGSRMRAARHPEPPQQRVRPRYPEAPPPQVSPPQVSPPRATPPRATPRPIRPPEPRDAVARPTRTPEPQNAVPRPARGPAPVGPRGPRRPVAASPATEQLSFEDQSPDSD
jgi:hypothetical protein